MIGEKLGSFRIEAVLGTGAMGVVYRGTNESTGKPAAVKVISGEIAKQGKAYQRFKREAEILQQFRHPNIVHFLAVGRFKGTSYFAMEFIAGETLEQMISRRGPIPWREVVDLGIQICEALHYSHEHGVVHRHLVPSNLMVNEQGQIKLIDFGIAKDLDATALTMPGQILGAPAYMAPEQIRGTPAVSHKTDLYALGNLFYEMLTGQAAFTGSSAAELMHGHLNQAPPRPSARVPEVPKALDDLVVKLMAKSPDDRPSHAVVAGLVLAQLCDAVEKDAPAADGVTHIWSPGDVILGLYEVKPLDTERDYAEGGMGRVYRVHHRGWDLDMAVKSPLPENLKDAGAIASFEREAKTWVTLGLHPHTVTCYYVRRLGGIPRVFAEFIPGGSLKDWIDSGKLYAGGPQQALERVLDVAIQFALGLHHAHEHGLVHQDVKPANVMLTVEGTAKVTDFGLARARAGTGEAASVKPGQSILVSTDGMTPAYCSPEQAQRRPLSRRTDIWSWAVSVLEMFTGDVTWPSGTVAGAALTSYLEMGAGDDRLPAMPDGVMDLLLNCLQHDPQARPASMSAIAVILREEYTHATGRVYPRPEPAAVKATADSLNLQAVSLLDLASDGEDRDRKYAEAEALWAEALRVDPLHLESTYNMGLCRWRVGRMTYSAFLSCLRYVGRSASEPALVAWLLARVHLETGDSESAVRVLEEFLTDESDEILHAELKRARDQRSSSYRCLLSLEGHTYGVTSVALSVDSRLALSGGGDKTLRLWDVSDGRCLRTFEGHTEVVNSVALSADGRLALSGGGDKTLRLWDVSDGRCLRTFEGHTEVVNSVALSADGQLALSGGGDKTLRLWDVSDGRCLRTFEGHTEVVNSVALSADGRLALSVGGDKTLRLWDMSEGRCLLTLEGHTDRVWSVALSADGRFAVSGSGDRTLRRWTLDWELEDRPPADWDEGARPYLAAFLSAHTPYAADLPQGREPSAEELTLALTRWGKPVVSEEDFQQLLFTLGCAGYGWIRPEGVRRVMERIVAEWLWPPPLPGT
jgi:serine/threonine protein kinase/WD40 repeat protein